MVRQIPLVEALNWNLDRIREHIDSLEKLIGSIEDTSGPTLALKVMTAQWVEFAFKWIDVLRETYGNCLGRSN